MPETSTQRLSSEKSIADETFIAAYPKGNFPVLLSYGFRPFFILAPVYLIISIILWSGFWTGLISLPFLNNPLQWHVYEMLFGVTSAMMIGFILTVVPELYESEPPIVGKTLLALIIFWVIGRISFWFIDWLGIYIVALTNIPLLIWVVILVAKPILQDPLRRQLSLAILFVTISGMQTWFFVAQLNWVNSDPSAILKASIGVFMVLVLLATRRINTEAINRWLEQQQIDATYMARSPRYNIAIFTIIAYTLVEYFFPHNSSLSWLAFATMAAILNTLNDFFLEEDHVFLRPFIWPLFMLLVLMAIGYGMIGWDHLKIEMYALNHFRHFLTMGALGMAYYMVLVIVTHLHTGRNFIPTIWVGLGAFLIIAGTLLRSIGHLFLPEQNQLIIALSTLLWIAPFIGFLALYRGWLLKPRIDGLPG